MDTTCTDCNELVRHCKCGLFLGVDDRNLRHVACAGCGAKNMRPTGDSASGNQNGCDFDAERFQCVVCGEDYWW